jgi:hypothetical protein
MTLAIGRPGLEPRRLWQEPVRSSDPYVQKSAPPDIQESMKPAYASTWGANTT